jgi:hypothetical protein
MANFTPATTVTGTLTNAGNFTANNRPFQTFNHTHSNNTQTTTIVRAGNGLYHWQYSPSGDTSGWPTCPTSFRSFCPVQRNGGEGRVWIDVHGTHRGMGGGNYEEHYRIFFAGGSDSAHLEAYTIYRANSRFRLWIIEWDGSTQEIDIGGTNSRYQYGWNIGRSNSTQPLIFKIYTNCGADMEWFVSCRSDSTSFFPPFKGPTQVAGNTNPSFSTYQ